jgi:hypothetical protein
MVWDVQQEADEEVNTVEITYIDPNSSSVCCREVYCDPEDWDWLYQARLLVSSDLVNSLSEAIGIWTERFQQIHHRLQDSRMGYYYELWSIRQYLTRIFDFMLQQEAQKAAKDENAEDSVVEASVLEKQTLDAEETKPTEVCPVHFFNPDQYLDDWTKEHLRLAIISYSEELHTEIQSITERINLMGGGTWRQLLAYFLRHGQDPMELVQGLLHTIEDPAVRREMINTMTNGLQDQYDELLALVDSLQVERKDMDERYMEISNLERKQRLDIDSINKKMKEMQNVLKAPGFEEPEPEDDKEEVKQAQQKMFEKKEGNLKEYMAACRKKRAVLEEYRDRVANECDEEVITKLQEELKEWKRRIRMVNMRTDACDTQKQETEDRIAKLRETIDAERAKCDELRAKLGVLPPPNPATLQKQRLLRQIGKLNAEARKLGKTIQGPMERIQAMRAQLRVLYQKLGWEWDLSDSEDDDDMEEKPYWMRRKIAANGFLPFDSRSFLLSEQDYHRRRRLRLQKKGQKEQKKSIVAQMVARRVTVLGLSPPETPHAPTFDCVQEVEEETSVPKSAETRKSTRRTLRKSTSVASDPVYDAITAARATLSGSREVQTPCWLVAQREEERQRRRIELDRLVQLRETFEIQLQQCVECCIDFLPQSGHLGELRSRLWHSLALLRQLPENSDVMSQQDVQQVLATLQGLMEEAIYSGEHVRPISAVMAHSVRFKELRSLLDEVLQNEQEMRDALEALAKRSLVTDSFESSMEDPNGIRRQTAPGGSSGDFGVDAGSMSTSEQLSESLRLPPRLLAQTSAPFLGQQPKKHRRKKVDFGFRPDGAGEDSVENWSLFKVSKGAFSSASSGFGDTVSTGIGLTSSSGFPSDKVRRTETKIRHHRASFDCDFHEYMAQTRDNAQGNWQTASAPSLLPSVKTGQEKKKKWPSLPKLINGRDGRAKSGPGNSAVDFPMRGDGAGWAACPNRINAPRPTESTRIKFAATSNALFVK